MNDLAADVQTYLAAQGLVDGTTSWPSTLGQLHDESDRLVQIAEDVGDAPEVHASEGLGSAAFVRPAVLITVRGAPHERTEARAKAAAIYDELHALLDATLDADTYLQIRARSSEFARVYDDRMRPRYSMGYMATAAAVA